MSTITTRAGKGSALTHNELDANFKKAAQAKTALYTVAESDNRDTIECSGTFTVTMPDVATVVAASDTGDFQVTIKNTGSGVITIGRTTGADTIDGVAANMTLSANDCITLKTNTAGNGYIIITGNKVARGTIAFSSISTSGFGIVTSVAHGLGTDDIDFGFSLDYTGSVGNAQSIGAYVATANDAFIFLGDTSTLPISGTATAGEIRANVFNGTAGTVDINVNWWAKVI